MLDNASLLPPVPVHHLPHPAGRVVQPALVALKRRPQHRDAHRRPDGPQDIQRRVGPVGRERVVVLDG